MFCTECGVQVAGKFCAQCGHPRESAELTPAIVGSWELEVNYRALIQVAEIRQALERLAASSPWRLSGEQFLSICDKILSSPVSFNKLAGIVQPMYASWGIATGKKQVALVRATVGRVIVRALCSLARHGQKINDVQQAEDGCTIMAVLPSDVFALAGELLVSLRRGGPHTHVEMATKIGGQLFDWGKSRRSLDRLVADLQHDHGNVWARHEARAA